MFVFLFKSRSQSSNPIISRKWNLDFPLKSDAQLTRPSELNELKKMSESKTLSIWRTIWSAGKRNTSGWFLRLRKAQVGSICWAGVKLTSIFQSKSASKKLAVKFCFWDPNLTKRSVGAGLFDGAAFWKSFSFFFIKTLFRSAKLIFWAPLMPFKFSILQILSALQTFFWKKAKMTLLSHFSICWLKICVLPLKMFSHRKHSTYLCQSFELVSQKVLLLINSERLV